MIYFTLHSHTLVFITFAKHDFCGFFILVVCACFLIYTYFVLIFMSKLSRCHFYLLMEKPLGGYFQVQSPYYQAAQCNQKTPIPVSLRWQVRSGKAKKRISLNTKHSYHQRSSPQASLN